MFHFKMQKKTHLDKAPLAELRLAVLADWVQDDDILTVGQGGDVDNTDNLNTMTSQRHVTYIGKKTVIQH